MDICLYFAVAALVYCAVLTLLFFRLKKKYELFKDFTENFKTITRDEINEIDAEIEFVKNRFKGIEAAIAAVNSEVHELQNNMEPENMERNVAERIEKKWDDALNSIFNFDPFNNESEGDK